MTTEAETTDEVRTEHDVRGLLTRAAALAEEEAGGAEPRLRLGRLSTEDREELLAATTAHLAAQRPARRGAKVVSVEKGVQDWWAKLLGYADSRRQQRLNPLRNEVFAALSEADVIRRESGRDWSMVAGRKGSGPMVTRENLGAWVLKAKPTTWDVRRWIEDGGGPVGTWSVSHNYRSLMMTEGDPVLLWVSGDDPSCPAGFRARGTVTGPCAEGRAEGDYWLDRSARKRADYFAAVDLTPLDSVIARHTLVHHKLLSQIEVLRAPFTGNPSYLTTDQLAELESARNV
ncbi:hypothetical protein GCM10027020_33200 [Nocardioides salsibiostraticola]